MTGDSLDLIERLHNGDRQALDILLDRHYAPLRAYVRLRSGPLLRAKEESSDLVQSVCREVLERLDTFRFPREDAFRKWLYVTALRKIRHRCRFYRAGRRDARREARASAASDGNLLAGYATFCTPSRDAMAREQVADIEAAFDRLPEHYREVILLARVVGLSRAAIADHMGSTESAVRILLFRATAKLVGIMEQSGTRPPED